jgi:hypothetical protein
MTDDRKTMNPSGYYFCEIRSIERQLEKLDVRDLDASPTAHSTYPIKVWIEDEGVRWRAWFLESLHTALSHREPLIAFRALLQAYAYANDKRCYAFANERDYMIAARNRIEDVLRDVPRTPNATETQQTNESTATP